MPENQTQPRTGGQDNPQGSPEIGAEPPEPRGPAEARPSDTEAAHAPQEGRSFDQPQDVSPPRTDPNAGSGGGRDPRPDYGHPTGHSRPGTDRHTAGAEFADRMPEASSTPAVPGDTPGAKKSPTS
jgi:hypothetical protein